ncbi:hypothetical protein [Nocardia gipuzkoensis]
MLEVPDLSTLSAEYRRLWRDSRRCRVCKLPAAADTVALYLAEQHGAVTISNGMQPLLQLAATGDEHRCPVIVLRRWVAVLTLAPNTTTSPSSPDSDAAERHSRYPATSTHSPPHTWPPSRPPTTADTRPRGDPPRHPKRWRRRLPNPNPTSSSTPAPTSVASPPRRPAAPPPRPRARRPAELFAHLDREIDAALALSNRALDAATHAAIGRSRDEGCHRGVLRVGYHAVRGVEGGVVGVTQQVLQREHRLRESPALGGVRRWATGQ